MSVVPPAEQPAPGQATSSQAVGEDAGVRRTRMVHTYLTDDEKRTVTAKAAQLRLPVSDFLRRLALNAPLPNPADFAAHGAVRDILKVNADQARLGNLLKWELDALDERDLDAAARRKLESLHDDIRAMQRLLKSTAVRISESAAGGRRS